MLVTRSPRRRAPEAVARSVEDEAAALGLPVLELNVLWCRKFIAKGSGMRNKGD
jgi:hypothetical protein